MMTHQRLKKVDMPGDDSNYLETKQSSFDPSAPANVVQVLAGPNKKKKKIIKIPSELRPRALYPQQSRSFFHNSTTPKTWYDFEIFPKYKLSLEKACFNQDKAAVDTILVENQNGYIQCTFQMPNKTLMTILTSIVTPPDGLTPQSLKKIRKDLRQFASSAKYTPLPNEVVESNKIYLEVVNGFIHYTMRDMSGGLVQRSQKTQISIDASAPFILDTLSSKIEEQVIHAAAKHFTSSQLTYAGISVTNELRKAEAQQAYSNTFTIPEGSIGLIKLDGKPCFAAPGTYYKDSKVQHVTNRLVTDKKIDHESLHVITVFLGELVYAVDSQDVRNSKYLLPGIHFINSPTVSFKSVFTPNGIFIRILKTDEEYSAECKQNPKAKNYINTHIRVPDGKAYVAFNDKSIKRILGPGLHEIPPEWTVLENSISTKVQHETVEIFCQTQNGVDVCVKATVTYQIPIEDKGMGYEFELINDQVAYYVPGIIYIEKNNNNILQYTITEHAGCAPTHQGTLENIPVPYPYNLVTLNKLKDVIMEVTSAAGHSKGVECMSLAVTKFGPTSITEEIQNIFKEIVATQVKETDFNLDSSEGQKLAIIPVAENKEHQEDAPPAYDPSSLEAQISKKATDRLKKSKDIFEGGVKILNVCIHSMEPTNVIIKEAVAKAAANKIEIQSQIQLAALGKPEVRAALENTAATKIIQDSAHQTEMRRLQQEKELADARKETAEKEKAALEEEIEVENSKQRLAQLKAQNINRTVNAFTDGTRSQPSSSPSTDTITRNSSFYSTASETSTSSMAIHTQSNSR